MRRLHELHRDFSVLQLALSVVRARLQEMRSGNGIPAEPGNQESLTAAKLRPERLAKRALNAAFAADDKLLMSVTGRNYQRMLRRAGDSDLADRMEPLFMDLCPGPKDIPDVQFYCDASIWNLAD